MNMHGVFAAESNAGIDDTRGRWRTLSAWIVARKMFLGLVILPVTLLATYLFAICSDQYESEAHFLVKTTEPSATAGIGVSQILSMATGLSAAQGEAMSVADYLTSHDVVAKLRREDRLVDRFTRPGVDIFSKMWTTNPTPEKLLKFYRSHITVEYSAETASTTLKVHAFTPEDSYTLVRKLLVLGEQRVNLLNQRSYSDAIATSRQQLLEAEDALAITQKRMTSFRQVKADIDPTATGQAQIGLVSNLSQQLATARAQLSSMGGLISKDSPQYRAVASRVAALDRQVETQKGQLAGGPGAIAGDIEGYEDLKLRQEFAAKRYEARDQAFKQQLYVVRVVDANYPVKSTYPQRWRILATATVALLLLYAIAWLILAGVREHAA
jgi:capsular polysaccharide transport system permease protein